MQLVARRIHNICLNDVLLLRTLGKFDLRCSGSLSCVNEYLATDSGGCYFVLEQSSRVN